MTRMVRFYHEIAPDELHQICLYHLDEIKLLTETRTHSPTMIRQDSF
jgi:hypothetical protein